MFKWRVNKQSIAWTLVHSSLLGLMTRPTVSQRNTTHTLRENGAFVLSFNESGSIVLQ